MTARVAEVVSPGKQVRRAWLTIAVAAVVFLMLFGGVAAAGAYYYVHATETRSALVDVISGSGALWRDDSGQGWRLITPDTRLTEGDQISTALGTVLWVTLFDGSTLEVSENSLVTLDRMRVSRFRDRTKEVALTVEAGTLYLSMASRYEYEYSEFTAAAEGTRVVMSDEQGRDEAGTFLVEVVSTGQSTDGVPEMVRAAVLTGAAVVDTGSKQTKLTANQQVLVGPAGAVGEITPAVRQLIANGTFEYGLAGWDEFHDGDRSGSAQAGLVTLEPVEVDGREASAVQFSRAEGGDGMARAGIRQQVGQTLRVYSSLELSFDILIEQHAPYSSGEAFDQLPLVVELQYVDVGGEQRIWRRGYYSRTHPDHPVPAEVASHVEPGRWQRVVFDLGNLAPLPRQISSILVYASGSSYRSAVANISLTSSEIAQQ